MRRCRAPLSIHVNDVVNINNRIVVLGNRQRQKFDFDLYSPTISISRRVNIELSLCGCFSYSVSGLYLFYSVRHYRSGQINQISDALIDSVGDAKFNLQKLKKIKLTKNINYEIQSFIKITSRIIKDFPNLEILVDPLDIDESNYHTGIAFKVFSEKLLVSYGAFIWKASFLLISVVM